MSLPFFAELESSLAAATQAAFENIRLINGTLSFGAVLDRDVDTVGEYGVTGEGRSRITVLKLHAAGFVNGGTLSADPAKYTSSEIAAMPRSTWKLDRLADDDGHIVSWWLK